MSDENVVFGVHEVTVDLPTAEKEESGLVLKWRRRGDFLEGLVVRETGGRLITEWLPAFALTPLSENGSANEAGAAGGFQESSESEL